MPPAKQIPIVVCMDARLETGALLRLVEGDAHVIRNAGGIVTDDVIRSLTISQRSLGTREIMLIHHTDCGMLTFKDDDLKQQILDETGIKPQFAMEAFDNLDADVRQSIGTCQSESIYPTQRAGSPLRIRCGVGAAKRSDIEFKRLFLAVSTYTRYCRTTVGYMA